MKFWIHKWNWRMILNFLSKNLILFYFSEKLCSNIIQIPSDKILTNKIKNSSNLVTSRNNTWFEFKILQIRQIDKILKKKRKKKRDIPDSLILPLKQGLINIVAKFFPSTAAMKQTIMQLNWNDYSFPIAYILHQGYVSTIAKGRQGGKERRFFTQISPF